MMAKFKRKPELVEAIEWTYDNTDEVEAFLKSTAFRISDLYENFNGAREGFWLIKSSTTFSVCHPHEFRERYELAEVTDG